jgi:hypothetical protein
MKKKNHKEKLSIRKNNLSGNLHFSNCDIFLGMIMENDGIIEPTKKRRE